MSSEQNFADYSRRNFVTNDGSDPSRDQIKLGCLQRIAAAVEKSCLDRERLERDRDFYKRQSEDRQRMLEVERRRTAALRGVIGRLKRKAVNL